MQTFTCQWNMEWDTYAVDECVWVACMYPPVPEGRGLAAVWEGEPVEFFENVTYTCASSNLFFEEDRSKQDFEVTCLDSGYFDTPWDWPKCVSSKSSWRSAA